MVGKDIPRRYSMTKKNRGTKMRKHKRKFKSESSWEIGKQWRISSFGISRRLRFCSFSPSYSNVFFGVFSVLFFSFYTSLLLPTPRIALAMLEWVLLMINSRICDLCEAENRSERVGWEISRFPRIFSSSWRKALEYSRKAKRIYWFCILLDNEMRVTSGIEEF